MGCSSCGSKTSTAVKANVVNSNPKKKKGIALGGSQISSLPTPLVRIKK